MTPQPFTWGIRLAPQPGDIGTIVPVAAPLPSRVIIPLTQRDGSVAEPTVRVGDCVLRGTCLIRPAAHQLPRHAPTSGRVIAITEQPLPPPGPTVGLCVVIEADGEDRAIETPPQPDYRQRSKADVLAAIQSAGIAGLGGAAFPTFAKLASARAAIDLLVLNAAECEPPVRCDDGLLRSQPDVVLGGAKILRWLLDARRCVIAVSAGLDEAYGALLAAKAGGDFAAIDVVRVPARYPIGGERQLIAYLSGREVPAALRPPDIGALCQNVATAAAVHAAVVRGEPLISRIVSVGGPGVRRPANLTARLGTPISELIAACGGYSEFAGRLIMGGPMMGLSLDRDDLPLPAGGNSIWVAAGSAEIAEARPCIRCGACSDVCPSGLLPQELHRLAGARQWSALAPLGLSACIECGSCDYVCPSQIPLTAGFRTAKAAIAEQQQVQANADHARFRFEARQTRLAEQERLRQQQAEAQRQRLKQAPTPALDDVLALARQRRAAKLTPAVDGSRPEDPVA